MAVSNAATDEEASERASDEVGCRSWLEAARDRNERLTKKRAKALGFTQLNSQQGAHVQNHTKQIQSKYKSIYTPYLVVGVMCEIATQKYFYYKWRWLEQAHFRTPLARECVRVCALLVTSQRSVCPHCFSSTMPLAWSRIRLESAGAMVGAGATVAPLSTTTVPLIRWKHAMHPHAAAAAAAGSGIVAEHII